MLLSKRIPMAKEHIGQAMRQHGLTLVALLAMTGLSLALNQYEFATDDQMWYIPQIKRALNPALYPGDPVFDNLMAKGGGVLTHVIATAVKLLGFEWGFLVLYLVAVFATFGMVFLIGNWLQGREVGLLAVLFCVVRKSVGRTYSDTLEEAFHPRTLILPVSLLALYLCWRGRYGWAIIMATLVTLFHPISGVPVLLVVLLAVAIAWYRKETSWRPLILPIGLLAAAGAFVLFSSARESAGGRYFVVASPDWMQLAEVRLRSSVLPWRWKLSDWVDPAVWLGLLLLGLSVYPSKSANRFVYILIGALLFLVALAIVFSELLPLPLVIQLQFARSLVLLIMVSCVYGAVLVLHLIRQSDLLLPVSGVVLAILITIGHADLGVVGIVLGFVALNWRRLRPSPGAVPLANPGFAGPRILILIALILVGISPGVDLSPTIAWPRTEDRIKDDPDPWIQVQLWARDHTPLDSIFVVPADHEGFRVYSERRPLAEWKDGGIGLFDPEFGAAWRERLETQVQVLRSKPFDLDKFNQFYARYRFNYLVLHANRPSPPGWNKVYSNEAFVVYQEPH